MNPVQEFFNVSGYVVEAVGVLTIVVGCILSAGWFAVNVRRWERLAAYWEFRRDLGRAIVLGLEFLIAGDIIRTVTVTQTLESVAVLLVIVLIRTFLTMTLELEIEGRWPWLRAAGSKISGPRAPG